MLNPLLNALSSASHFASSFCRANDKKMTRPTFVARRRVTRSGTVHLTSTLHQMDSSHSWALVIFIMDASWASWSYLIYKRSQYKVHDDIDTRLVYLWWLAGHYRVWSCRHVGLHETRDYQLIYECWCTAMFQPRFAQCSPHYVTNYNK